MLDQEFKLKASKHFLRLLLIVSALSMTICLTLPVSHPWQLLCSFLLMIYMSSIFFRHIILFNKCSINYLKSLSDGKWELTKGNKTDKAELSEGSLMTPWVSVLRFRAKSGLMKQSCLIFIDSLAKDDYRRLQVKVRMF